MYVCVTDIFCRAADLVVDVVFVVEAKLMDDGMLFVLVVMALQI